MLVSEVLVQHTSAIISLVTFGTIPVVRLMLRCDVRIQILSVYKEFTTWTLIVLHSTRFLSKCSRLGLGLSLTTLFSFFMNFNFWWWNTNGKTLDFLRVGLPPSGNPRNRNRTSRFYRRKFGKSKICPTFGSVTGLD